MWKYKKIKNFFKFRKQSFLNDKKGQMWKYVVGFAIAIVLLLILVILLGGTTGKARAIVEKFGDFF